jgi:hypothetical protein
MQAAVLAALLRLVCATVCAAASHCMHKSTARPQHHALRFQGNGCQYLIKSFKGLYAV